MFDDQLLTMAAVKERGWTDAGIKRFLGEPDTTKDNPHYRKAAPMRLYDLKRVQAAESTDAFQEYKERASRRSASAKAAAAKKAEATIAAVDELEIRVPLMTRMQLKHKAIESWHELQMVRGNYEASDGRGADKATIERWCINYLRHECSPYEGLLDEQHGRVGADKARQLIRERVMAAIADTYPHLAFRIRKIKEADERDDALHRAFTELGRS